MSTAFHPLTVIDVTHETDDAVAVTLAPAEDQRDAFAFTPGQHLTFRKTIDGEDIRRNYSICVAPGAGAMKVAIKHVEGGRFSGWAMDQLNPGDTIEAMTPRGHFTWTFDANASHHYLAFAAGSGITPVLSLIATGLATEPDSHFTLLYGNRTSQSVMFLEELGALKDRYLDRFQLYHFLTAEFDDVDLFNGRLDEARIGRVLSELVDPKSVDVAFICGPGAMMDSAEAAMLAAGIARDKVLLERFNIDRPDTTESADQRQSRERAQGLKMQVAIDGRRRVIPFDAELGNILDSARAAGLPAPYACKAGVCATCRAKLVSGEVSMKANYGLSEEEVAQGYILTCQAIPAGEGVVLDYDA